MTADHVPKEQVKGDDLISIDVAGTGDRRLQHVEARVSDGVGWTVAARGQAAGEVFGACVPLIMRVTGKREKRRLICQKYARNPTVGSE